MGEKNEDRFLVSTQYLNVRTARQTDRQIDAA